MIAISVPAFRTLVASSFVAVLLSAIADMSSTLPPQIDSAYEAWMTEAMEGGLFLLLAVIALPLLVATLVAGVGLLLFKRWSRTLALILTVASLCLYPFLEVSVVSGWVSLFDYLAAFLWGATLAVAYASPIAQRFEPSATAAV